MKEKVYLFDIGNTSIAHGIGQNGRLHGCKSIHNSNIPKFDQFINKSGLKNINIAVISSVVPKLTNILLEKLRKKGLRTPYVVGRNLRVPIKTKYRNPGNLGADRLVNAYGAAHFAPPPLVVIDFGTALTVDYVSKDGVFQGGLIIPGPEISYQSLIRLAARIPKNTRLPKTSKPFSLIGRDTKECMQAGVLHSYGAMTDELIKRFRKKYGPAVKSVATGGFSRHLKPYSALIQKTDPLLTLKSLYLIYLESLKKS